MSTLFRVAVRGAGKLYRFTRGNVRVSWMPDGNKSMHKRLLVCVHMQEAGHRGMAGTLTRLFGYCVRSGRENGARDLVSQCLYCDDSRAGGLVPQLSADMVHDVTVKDVVHFDLLCFGERETTRGTEGLDGYTYMNIVLEDIREHM